MNSTTLKNILKHAVVNKRNLLIKGIPGCGKTAIVKQISQELGCELVISHPAISDPTDYKGLPANVAGYAEFLPYGDLRKLMEAKHCTLCLLDDIGQSNSAVQAALMQVVHSREINGKKISPDVVFIGCTNDTSHMAGVGGMIEPLKSRWASIVTLNVDWEAWITWARENGIVNEVIAYITSNPKALSDFKPTRELTNSPSPRAWEEVSKWIKDGVMDLEIMEGVIGKETANFFWAYCMLIKDIPNIEEIIKSPKDVNVPENGSVRYFVALCLAGKVNTINFANILTYLKRLPKDLEVYGVKQCMLTNRRVVDLPVWDEWAKENQKFIL